jgi:hypothetical protein
VQINPLWYHGLNCTYQSRAGWVSAPGQQCLHPRSPWASHFVVRLAGAVIRNLDRRFESRLGFSRRKDCPTAGAARTVTDQPMDRMDLMSERSDLLLKSSEFSIGVVATPIFFRLLGIGVKLLMLLNGLSPLFHRVWALGVKLEVGQEQLGTLRQMLDGWASRTIGGPMIELVSKRSQCGLDLGHEHGVELVTHGWLLSTCGGEYPPDDDE